MSYVEIEEVVNKNRKYQYLDYKGLNKDDNAAC